ncbi:MAG: metallopeptidase TldD-related protein [Peptoniphilaceae bacterium]|nr:metallopeptidase TldD-related protein [Peptoniphilaceae bacterium]MDY6085599.1 metallopeptidase TldD-related protein [Peptoniphilaceae bacterium]
MQEIQTQIIEALKQSAASDWVVRRETQRTNELFFVRDQLDMNRAAETTDFIVTVYVDFEKEGESLRGHAQINLSPLDSTEEITRQIEDGLAQAQLVENRYYPLPENAGEVVPAGRGPAEKSLRDQLVSRFPQLMDAFFHRENPVAQVNSVELFVEEKETQVLTSKGVDVTYPHNTVEFELVTDAEGQTESVEVFTIYKLASLDVGRIAEIVDAQLEETAGRAVAEPARAQENARVLITGDAVEQFFDVYLNLAAAKPVFLHATRAQLGEPIVEGEAKNPVTIDMVPDLAHSPEARPIDGEGVLLKPYRLIDHGVVKAINADAQYGHYLGVPITGGVRTYVVEPGTVAWADLEAEPRIEILKFSSFQADFTTGDFGGEFRLAKQHEDGKTRFITAGAISENLFTQIPKMQFTVERQEGAHSLVPKAVILDGVTITGSN